jgi:response regulator RpfG family c-di-GMP phosphodiesterase
MATPVEEQSLLSTATTHGLAVKRHLLVVDDNEINRILLQALLRRRGYKVTLAKGG